MEKNLVKRFFTGTSGTYDLVVNLFTYGADRYWKKKILARTPRSRKILDLACGTGILTFKLAKRNPCCLVVGVDVMLEYLRRASRKLRGDPQCNVHFVHGRAEEVTFRDTFDCVTSSYIPKYVPADALLANIVPYLKPGGVLVLHDFAYPQSRFFRKLWGLHLFLMKIVGTPIFPHWRPVFKELGDLVKTSDWIQQYRNALPRYGFEEIVVERLTAGSAAVISAKKRAGN